MPTYQTVAVRSLHATTYLLLHERAQVLEGLRDCDDWMACLLQSPI